MKTAVQPTSIQAYADIMPELPDRQRQVFECVRQHGIPMTNSEIAYTLNLPINRVVGRTNELVKLGKLRQAGKRPCNITGRTCMTWVAVVELKQEELFT